MTAYTPNRLKRERLSVLLCLFALWPIQGAAQTESSTDGTTPPAISPGSPTGSYALSGFDTVNLYAGKVNFAIPLLMEAGRGKANYGLTLSLERNWNVQKTFQSGTPILTPVTAEVPGDTYWNTQIVDSYQPGFMVTRPGVTQAFNPCTTGHTADFQSGSTLTRLTWTSPDGTQTEFVDQQTGGNLLSSSNGCVLIRPGGLRPAERPTSQKTCRESHCHRDLSDPHQ
jgi:hypothetical protein